MGWLPLVAVVAMAVIVGRWWRRRVDALGRRRTFPWISLALLGVLAVAAAVPGLLRAAQERRLGTVASALAGHKVAVRCQNFGGAALDGGPELGYVRWRADGTPEDWTLIKRDQCADLAAYVRAKGREPTEAQVLAVHILSHEAMHLAGLNAESLTECAAVQRDAHAARLLGAAPGDAATLARSYWESIYPRMRDEYRTKECRPGGDLDERLPDAPWATAGDGARR